VTNLSKAHPIRLNPEENQLLSLLERLMSPERFEYLVTKDRDKREGYRGHSGRKPQSRSLLLRRAVELGLPLVSQELGNIERRARSHVDQDAVATTLIGEDSVRLLDSIRDGLVHAHGTDTHCPTSED
jgi:hypothetical protein